MGWINDIKNAKKSHDTATLKTFISAPKYRAMAGNHWTGHVKVE